ncbi:MAG: plasmid stabilization protein [Bacteroidetes bacterium 4572_77]|nr:MAG: plasmid stabilization protein [Bacteroidetes bacterium 4572_77]
MKYKISQEASRDIEKIWIFTIEKWSAEQADRYFNLTMNEIEHLAKDPKYGKNYGEVRKGYFRSRIKSHFIFYKINRRNQEIEIIRILHQRMDIETLLNE